MVPVFQFGETWAFGFTFKQFPVTSRQIYKKKKRKEREKREGGKMG